MKKDCLPIPTFQKAVLFLHLRCTNNCCMWTFPEREKKKKKSQAFVNGLRLSKESCSLSWNYAILYGQVFLLNNEILGWLNTVNCAGTAEDLQSLQGVQPLLYASINICDTAKDKHLTSSRLTFHNSILRGTIFVCPGEYRHSYLHFTFAQYCAEMSQLPYWYSLIMELNLTWNCAQVN